MNPSFQPSKPHLALGRTLPAPSYLPSAETRSSEGTQRGPVNSSGWRQEARPALLPRVLAVPLDKQRVSPCHHCTDISTMAGKGWKMPLQAQPARGNVTGRNHLPNNAQETRQAGDFSLLGWTHLAAGTSQGLDNVSSRLRLHSSHPALKPPFPGEILLCSPELWYNAPTLCLGVA